MKREDAIVYVVDDDTAVREALSSLVRAEGLRVRTFGSADEFLAAEREDVPSCLVLDVRLPGDSGLELQRELGGLQAPLPIIFITGYGDVPMSVRAMKQGAAEFLQKPFGDAELLAAIDAALARERIRRAEAAQVRANEERFAELTAREREVLQHVVAGKLNKQIAAELGITEITVKVHRRHIMEKLCAESLPDLVRLAEKARITGA